MEHQRNLQFLADDFGWGDVSMHGSGAIQTPNLDGLAKGGINLTHYYTQHICTPTRSALLSSRYPIHTGLQTNVIAVAQPSGLHKNETLFPEYMEGMQKVHNLIILLINMLPRVWNWSTSYGRKVACRSWS